MDPIIARIREALKQNADPHARAAGQRFFKEAITLYGVSTAVVRRIAKESYAELQDRDKGGIFALCEALWRSGYIEESFIACEWAYRRRGEFQSKDFAVFSRWVKRYVTNWASCDTLCNHTLAALVEMYPRYLADLKKWTKSPNRWVRRASAVTLIVPARKGDFLDDIFEIADLLLLDEDDLVRKGYGWLLKAASESHPMEVFDYVMRNKRKMPRTALRYAIEKMPAEMRQTAMEK